MVDIQNYVYFSLADEKKYIFKQKSNKEVMLYDVWQYFMCFMKLVHFVHHSCKFYNQDYNDGYYFIRNGIAFTFIIYITTVNS